MAYINTIRPADAAAEVREMYDRQQRKYGYVPNYAKVFSHRPHVMKLWADLLYGIRQSMDPRRFELVTVAAAMAVKSTYCSLAHGKALTAFYSSEETLAIVTGSDDAPLREAEVEMMRFARKVARHASEIAADDVARLKAHGFDDAEIFDIAAAATARTFFAQLCEGLGALGDRALAEMHPRLRDALTVGRRFETGRLERLADSYDKELDDGMLQAAI
jgi:uncharacterized peroxidase-related enzyme